MHIIRPIKIALVAITSCLLMTSSDHAGVSLVNAQSCEIRQRQDILSLTSRQLDAFFKAVRTLQSQPQPNNYDMYAKIHLDYYHRVHGSATFLSWHRIFIRSFEYQLQLIDPNVMLPYWDWSISSQAPNKHKVFSSDWFGGNGRSSDNCVTTGKFAAWRPYYSQHNCMWRRFRGSPDMEAFYSPEALRYVADRSDTYEEFNRLLEAPAHNLVHYNIGGDMGTAVSPNDPLFFIHHAFIDMQWAMWQARNPRYANDYGGVNSDRSRASRNDVLRPFNIRAGDVLDTRRLCYVYDRLAGNNNNNRRRGLRRRAPLLDSILSIIEKLDIGGIVRKVMSGIHLDYPGINLDLSSIRVTDDLIKDIMGKSRVVGTTQLTKDNPAYVNSLRPCAPLSTQMLLDMNLNVTFVRETEAILKKLTVELNSQKDYVSPAALINQPEQLMDVAANRTEVYVTKGKREVPVEVPRFDDGTVDIDALLVATKTALAALNKAEERNPTETEDIPSAYNLVHSNSGILDIL